MNLTVLCDFDGTITLVDTAEYILRKFAEGDWEQYERQLRKGELSLEKALQKEFALVNVSKERMLAELEDAVAFRPSFDEFAQYCHEKTIPLIIVSAGLDFVIDHYLTEQGWKDIVTTFMPTTRFEQKRVGFRFPEHLDDKSANFKHDLVRRCKANKRIVAFIGDGTGDFEAAKESDYRFAVKRSNLAKLLRKNKIPFFEITDFKQVINDLERIM